MAMMVSRQGIALIQSFESCKLTAYKALSTEEHYTIGWGHYGADVRAGQTISQDEADALFLVCAPWARSNGCKSRTRLGNKEVYS